MTAQEFTEDMLWEKYKPIKNLLKQQEGFEGCIFDAYGAELEFVMTQNPKKIWTIMEENGALVYQAGYHLVNRIGYLVCEHEWENDTLEIIIPDEFPEDGA
jgi:hypothetical protein